MKDNHQGRKWMPARTHQEEETTIQMTAATTIPTTDQVEMTTRIDDIETMLNVNNMCKL